MPERIPKFSTTLKAFEQEFPNSLARILKFANKNSEFLCHSPKFFVTLENCQREFQNSPPLLKITSENSKIRPKNPEILRQSQKLLARIQRFSATLEISQQEFQNLQARIGKFSATLENCQREFRNSQARIVKFSATLASENPKILGPY